MKITIFGGTGGVGRHLVGLALDAGHEVTAFARSPDKVPRRDEVRVVEGQLDDADALGRAIAGADAVLSALGARENAPEQVELFGAALERITQAMSSHGVRRLVSISGAGVITPDDHVTIGRRVIGLIISLVSKHVMEAKRREYEVITGTDLDWVIVRPPRILEGPATGTYRVLPDRPPSSSISQGDVAHLMLACASGDQWVRQAPIPGY